MPPPVFNQRWGAHSGGVATRALPCQPQAMRAGASMSNSTRASGPANSAARRATLEVLVAPPVLPGVVGSWPDMDPIDPAAPADGAAASPASHSPGGLNPTGQLPLATLAASSSPPAASLPTASAAASAAEEQAAQSHALAATAEGNEQNHHDGASPEQHDHDHDHESMSGCVFNAAAAAVASAAAAADAAAASAASSPLSSSAAAAAAAAGPTAHPVSYLEEAAAGSAASSGHCSAASSVNMSGACAFSSAPSAAASARLPSASCDGVSFSAHSGVTHLAAAAAAAISAPGFASSKQLHAPATADRHSHHNHHNHAPHVPSYRSHPSHGTVAGSPPLSSLVSLPSLPSCGASVCSRRSLRDQNSVTIKATTVVKDAAGAIDKILARGVTALVTAMRNGAPPYGSPYDSLNQAVKAIAVARQYAKETGAEGAEVTFLPFHRNDSCERPDPARFAFLVFPVAALREALKTADETVLNVARGSDVHKMASAIIAVMLDRGQAVMKAAGSDAIFVAMSAVVNARHRLVSKHGFDLMLAAAWITEDTMSTMGRESKFLRFNILKTEPAGPKSEVAPTLPAGIMECC